MDELNGSIVALVTPMLRDGSVDFESLKKLLDWHEQASTSALIVLGSTGEGTLFSPKEREAIVDFVVKNSNLPIWVGVSGLYYDQISESVSQVADLGADGVMLTAPLYVKADQSGLISFFSKIADQSELEVLLYNQPERVGSKIDVETACILSEHTNIIGIKDSVISKERMIAYQEAKDGFSIFSGDDLMMLTCMAMGGSGAVSVIGNLLPELVQTVCLLSEKRIYHKAEAIELQWQNFANLLGKLPNPPAIKYAMSKQGLIEPGVRMPLSLLSKPQQAKMDEVLNDLSSLLSLNPEHEE